MNGYNGLSQISLIISICFGIISLIGCIVFGRFLKKRGNKLVEEIEPQLNRILRLIMIAVVLCSIFGVIGILFHNYK